MFTLLGGPDDRDLSWLAAALQGRGESVAIVLPDEMLADARLTLRIDSTHVSSTLVLPHGRHLGSDAPGVVINRLTELPARAAGSALDTTYLDEEWRAAVTAWLRTLRGPVLNPPRASSLGGPVMSVAMWRSLAQAHGIACRPWRHGTSVTDAEPIDLLVVGDICLDVRRTAPAGLHRRLVQLSRSVGAPLLGASFDGDWELLGATASPPLEEGGGPLVDALIRLSRRPEGR